MGQRTCDVPGCTMPHKRGGYCYGHYMKDWRYGTPTPDHPPQWVDLRGRRFGTLVVRERRGSAWYCECDCGRSRLARAGDLNRCGDSSTCGHRATHRRSDTAGYGAAHDRIRRERGAPRDHECVDCGQQARHWSYEHNDPDERLGTSGYSKSLIAYSLNPEHYVARCVPCHKRFDLAHQHSTPDDLLTA